ncbi:glucokinase [Cochlodiniinecator piscidefendens]|uniref:glucokinase n=1 Tax=Cochlodiniinecator piscidefendens TaxID=2715756 RepID=UPI001409D0E4|nr:ROK family protein [Cochlodiniinecator piscidefendens]
MKILVADVGGTNSRLALATENGVETTTIRRFENQSFTSFYDVIAAFLDELDTPEITHCCAALAGPIAGTSGRLTNRDWIISLDGLKNQTGANTAVLINDLSALGYSLDHLSPKGTDHICGAFDHPLTNDQSLVVGIGTGFNVCPVKRTTHGTVCLAAEGGHIQMPQTVLAILAPIIGTEINQFPTVEHLFSGRGLEALHSLITAKFGMSGLDIVNAHLNDADPLAAKTLSLYSEALGALCQQHILQYMPQNGIYFAGSVARGVFSAGFHDVFKTALRRDALFDQHVEHVPISVILEDEAALIGCATAART